MFFNSNAKMRTVETGRTGILDKLIGLTTIGSSLAGFALLQRFLSSVTGVIALTVVSALMTGLLLMGAFASTYFALTYYGLEPMIAVLLVTTLACLITALLISITLTKLRRLRDLSQQSMYRDIPSLAHVGDVFSAFIKGLKAHSLHPHK